MTRYPIGFRFSHMEGVREVDPLVQGMIASPVLMIAALADMILDDEEMEIFAARTQAEVQVMKSTVKGMDSNTAEDEARKRFFEGELTMLRAFHELTKKYIELNLEQESGS